MSSDGAVLELVTRGRKDAFFIHNPQHTWFSTAYERRSPTVREMRVEVPVGPVQFGHWVDFALPQTGDVLTRAEIRIRLPTWLPPEIAALNLSQTVELQATNGTWGQYGWTNRIANYLVKRWALFSDTLILQEGWGVVSAWLPDVETTHNHAPLLHAMTGAHDGSAASIQRAATPPELVFRIPLAAKGLPLCALKRSRLYLRFWLRARNELVESTIAETMPWNGRPIRVNGLLTGSVTLSEACQPSLSGRFDVLHCDPELREALANKTHHLLIEQQSLEEFPLETSGIVKRRLETTGFFQSLFVGIQSKAARRQNRLSEFLTNVDEIAFDINSQERIHSFTLIRELATNTQVRRDFDTGLFPLIFGATDEPAGTCNLARVHKAVLKINMPADGVVMVMGIAWNVLEIRDGRIRKLFVDS